MSQDTRANAPSLRYRAGRAALRLAVAIIVVYAGAMVWLVTQETRLVFRAGATLGTSRPSPPMTQVDITRADGLRQFGWEMRRPVEATSAPWVLFLHGNAGSIASRVNIARN